MRFPFPLHSTAVELQKPQANKIDKNLSLGDEHQQQQQQRGQDGAEFRTWFTPVLSRQLNMRSTGKPRAEVTWPEGLSWYKPGCFGRKDEKGMRTEHLYSMARAELCQ